MRRPGAAHSVAWKHQKTGDSAGFQNLRLTETRGLHLPDEPQQWQIGPGLSKSFQQPYKTITKCIDLDEPACISNEDTLSEQVQAPNCRNRRLLVRPLPTDQPGMRGSVSITRKLPSAAYWVMEMHKLLHRSNVRSLRDGTWTILTHILWEFKVSLSQNQIDLQMSVFRENSPIWVQVEHKVDGGNSGTAPT
ncbi:hypothetical protein CSKR_107644 [Clonorchis sinensis]|uniref:Uncharacterized protein n=1 Tax=Clonorchis sinensis TaxID=79923 RepID=A0A3R7GYZ2_CLOSI|nr:hypothetical protein CSKR_107644 [Clonorchis sinensis]